MRILLCSVYLWNVEANIFWVLITRRRSVWMKRRLRRFIGKQHGVGDASHDKRDCSFACMEMFFAP